MTGEVKTECVHCSAKFVDYHDYARHLLEKHPDDKVRADWAREVLESASTDEDAVLEEVAREVASRCQGSADRIEPVTTKLLRERHVKLSKSDRERVVEKAGKLVIGGTEEPVEVKTSNGIEMSNEQAAAVLDVITANTLMSEELRNAAAIGRNMLIKKPPRLSDLLVVSQTAEFTTQLLSYGVGDIYKLMVYRERFGDVGHLGELKAACADSLLNNTLLAEQLGYDLDELKELGFERFRDRMNEAKKGGTKTTKKEEEAE